MTPPIVYKQETREIRKLKLYKGNVHKERMSGHVKPDDLWS